MRRHVFSLLVLGTFSTTSCWRHTGATAATTSKYPTSQIELPALNVDSEPVLLSCRIIFLSNGLQVLFSLTNEAFEEIVIDLTPTSFSVSRDANRTGYLLIQGFPPDFDSFQQHFRMLQSPRTVRLRLGDKIDFRRYVGYEVTGELVNYFPGGGPTDIAPVSCAVSYWQSYGTDERKAKRSDQVVLSSHVLMASTYVLKQ